MQENKTASGGVIMGRKARTGPQDPAAAFEVVDTGPYFRIFDSEMISSLLITLYLHPSFDRR